MFKMYLFKVVSWLRLYVCVDEWWVSDVGIRRLPEVSGWFYEADIDIFQIYSNTTNEYKFLLSTVGDER